jgi:hypothetical protein
MQVENEILEAPQGIKEGNQGQVRRWKSKLLMDCWR